MFPTPHINDLKTDNYSTWDCWPGSFLSCVAPSSTQNAVSLELTIVRCDGFITAAGARWNAGQLDHSRAHVRRLSPPAQRQR